MLDPDAIDQADRGLAPRWSRTASASRSALVLAVAVTVIEVALIVTLMVSGGPETATLARDTVFAAVMITCNGIVGVSLLVGALRRASRRSTPRARLPSRPWRRSPR